MTKLIRTKIEDQDNTNNLEKEPTKLYFTITTLLSDDLKEINKKKLFKLGSLGLAKRVNLIIKRGLIK